MTDGERFDALEFKVAHLERSQQDLSDVLVRQQQELERLNARLARIQQLLEAGQEPAAPAGGFEIPPHY